MERIFGAMALGAALCLSIAATPVQDETGDDECVSAPELTLLGNEIKDVSLSNYHGEFEGTLINGSKVQSYDDVTIRIDYYDEQEQIVRSEAVKIRKDLEPGESEDFSIAIYPPNNAARASYAIACAEQDRSFMQRLWFWSKA
jgi:hypothetical protein